MSALGHKQTYAAQKGMSALPPIADITVATARSENSSCRWAPPSYRLGQAPQSRGLNDLVEKYLGVSFGR